MSAETCTEDAAKSVNDDVESIQYRCNKFEIWGLGTALAISAQLGGWNIGLYSGFGSYFIGQLFVALAYVVLMFCILEISSVIKFSGGCFGLTRVMIGFYPGFIVGYVEYFEYLVFLADYYTFISEMFFEMYIGNRVYLQSLQEPAQFMSYQPLVWVGITLVIISIVWRRSRVLWTFCLVISILSVFYVVVYFVGSMYWADLPKYGTLDDDYYGDHQAWFAGGIRRFLFMFPTTAYGYSGIESLALIRKYSETDEHFVHGVVGTVLTLFVSNFLILFAACSQPPGISSAASAFFPLHVLYKNLFGWDALTTVAVNFVLNIGQVVAYCLPLGTLLQSLVASKLVPSFGFLNHPNTSRHVLFSLALVIGLSGTIFYNVNVANYLTTIAIMCGTFMYFCTLWSYVVLG